MSTAFTRPRRTHIVVGGGTSGLVLVNLLLNAGDNVILIEQGSGDVSMFQKNLPFSTSSISWSAAASAAKSADSGTGINVLTEAIPELGGRRLLYPQGYGLGGTSNINAGIFSAGSPLTFDRHWPPGWSAQHMEKWLMTARSVLCPTVVYAAPGAARRAICLQIDAGSGEEGNRASNCVKGIESGHAEPGALLHAAASRARGAAWTEENVNGGVASSSPYWASSRTDSYLAAAAATATATATDTTTSERQQKETDTPADAAASLCRGRRIFLSENALGALRQARGGELAIEGFCKVEFVRFEGNRAVSVAVTRLAGGGGSKSHSQRCSPMKPTANTPHVHATSSSSAASSHSASTFGLEYIHPSNGGEIILCCGVLHSPRVLVASGLYGASLAHPESSLRCESSPSPSPSLARESANAADPDPVGGGVAAGRAPVAPTGRRTNSKSPKRSRKKGSQIPPKSEHQPLPFLLPAIGQNVQDHVVLPVLVLGNWRSLQAASSYSSSYGSERSCNGGGGGGGTFALCLRALVKLPSLFAWAVHMLCAVCWELLLPARLWSSKSNPFCSNQETPPPQLPLPPNGVHGWILLDAQGEVLPPHEKHSKQGCSDNSSDGNSAVEPTSALLFCDGECAWGLIPELLLPRWSEEQSSKYWTGLRPILYKVLYQICSWYIVRLILRNCVCGFLVCLMRPWSRGYIKFAEQRSLGQERLAACPAVELGVLSDPRDSDAMWAAMCTAQKMINILQQRDGFECVQIMPGILWRYARTPVDFRRYLSLFGAPFYHMCGTCSMACNRDAIEVEKDTSTTNSQARATQPKHGVGVVDARLRVRGIRGLRIADASVFPHIPTAPIAATCMAVAAAAAQFLLDTSAVE